MTVYIVTMIETPTVFVLGAGASSPYGFPTGAGLRADIIKTIRASDGGPLLQLGFDETDFRRFTDALEKSATNSVDAFLENRAEFRELGKLAIAWRLIMREQEKILYDFRYRRYFPDLYQNVPESFEDEWYSYFVDQLATETTFDKFHKNCITIITFNYDRSFEHFLLNALKERYGKSDDEAAGELRKLAIIHVYGSLGKHPYLGADGLPYSHDITPARLRSAADAIRIIREDETEEIASAHLQLKNAKKVYFLGFGYNDTNLRRLRLDHLDPAAKVFGSCYNLTERRKNDIQASLAALGMRPPISFGSSDLRILSYIEEHVSFRG
jgi:hypothetical protein